MLENTMLVFVLFLLFYIAIQDLKKHSFSIILFLFLSIAMLFICFLFVKNNASDFFLFAGINGLINILLIISCYFFSCFFKKNGSLKNIIGLGDILFLFLLGICFSPYNYIFLLLLSFIAAIFYAILYSLIKKLKLSTIKIPLVSFFSISFGSYLFLALLFQFNYYWFSIFSLK
jgi:hypothetical protein